MPAPIQLVLNPEEDWTLTELWLATTVPQHTRDRAPMLRLNAQDWTVPAIAETLSVTNRPFEPHCVSGSKLD